MGRVLGAVLGCLGLVVLGVVALALWGGADTWRALRRGDLGEVAGSMIGLDEPLAGLVLRSAARDADGRWTVVLDYDVPQGWEVGELEIGSVRLAGRDEPAEPLPPAALGEGASPRARAFRTAPALGARPAIEVTWSAAVTRWGGTTKVSWTNTETFALEPGR